MPKKKRYATKLHKAAANNDVYTIDDLCLFDDIDINAFDSDRNTALHLAAANNQEDATERLWSLGAIHQANNMGRTPLHLAAKAGHSNIVKFFLSKGRIERDEVDNYGMTAMELAKANGHTDLAKFMLKMGCSIQNNRDRDAAGTALRRRRRVDLKAQQHTMGRPPKVPVAAPPVRVGAGGITPRATAVASSSTAASSVTKKNNGATSSTAERERSQSFSAITSHGKNLTDGQRRRMGWLGMPTINDAASSTGAKSAARTETGERKRVTFKDIANNHKDSTHNTNAPGTPASASSKRRERRERSQSFHFSEGHVDQTSALSAAAQQRVTKTTTEERIKSARREIGEFKKLMTNATSVEKEVYMKFIRQHEAVMKDLQGETSYAPYGGEKALSSTNQTIGVKATPASAPSRRRERSQSFHVSEGHDDESKTDRAKNADLQSRVDKRLAILAAYSHRQKEWQAAKKAAGVGRSGAVPVIPPAPSSGVGADAIKPGAPAVAGSSAAASSESSIAAVFTTSVIKGPLPGKGAGSAASKNADDVSLADEGGGLTSDDGAAHELTQAPRKPFDWQWRIENPGEEVPFEELLVWLNEYSDRLEQSENVNRTVDAGTRDDETRDAPVAAPPVRVGTDAITPKTSANQSFVERLQAAFDKAKEDRRQGRNNSFLSSLG